MSDKTFMDFSPIEKHIQAGQLEQARRRLKKVELEKLTTAQLLTYFRYMRRVGEFHRGALLLEQYDQVLPELDLERAYFLGELGAFRQALQLLQKNILPLTSFDQQIEKQLHIGHFSSLAHNYPAAIQGYAEMARLAGQEKPLQHLIGKLNEIGHRIYAQQNLEEQIRAMEELRDSSLRKLPMLAQGACYFLCLAHIHLQDRTHAQRELKKALAMGVRHRLRESLLLKMTDFELNGSRYNKTAISRLKKSILEQNHIVYFDQFNKVMGRILKSQNEISLAEKYFLKVLYGQRESAHLEEVRRLSTLVFEDHKGWIVDGRQAHLLTPRQSIYNQVEKFAVPFLEKGKRRHSLMDESESLRNLILALSQNFEFQMRDAELCQAIWSEGYLHSYSIERLKSLVHRSRKSGLLPYLRVDYRKHKLGVDWVDGSSLVVRL